jgi:hypothetical protein
MSNSNTLSPFSQQPQKEQLSNRQILDQQIGGSDELSGGRLGDFEESPAEPTFSTSDFAPMDKIFEPAQVITDQAEYKVEHNIPATSAVDVQVNAAENGKFSATDSLSFATPDRVAQAHSEVARQKIESVFNSLSVADNQPTFGASEVTTPADEIHHRAGQHEGHSFLEKMGENPVVEFLSEKLPEIKETVKEAFETVGEMFKSIFGIGEKKHPSDPKKVEEQNKKTVNMEQARATIENSERVHEANKAKAQAQEAQRYEIQGKSIEEMNIDLGNSNKSYEQVFNVYHAAAIHKKEIAKIEEALKPKVITTPVAKGGINQQTAVEGATSGGANLSAANAGG